MVAVKRRRYLITIGTGMLAGCNTTFQATPTSTPNPTRAPAGVDLPVARDALVRGAPKNSIPAITDPAFGDDWSGLEFTVSDPHSGMSTEIAPRLTDDDTVIGIQRNGEARAYPLRLLNWHEVVNDEFAGPLLVTYCPLCGSGVTAVRTVNDTETTFGVSGWLWRSNLVLFDRRTESLWSQLLATAIRGPETGATLSLVPSALTTWATWRERYPDTSVLLPPPRSTTILGTTTRNYTFSPYSGYDETTAIPGRDGFDDDRLHPKTRVVGVTHGGVARAYPLPEVAAAGVINDRVGGLPVVVAIDADGRLTAYERRIDGEPVRFRAADAPDTGDEAADGVTHLRGANSRWDTVTGTAVGGALEGRTLGRANDRSPMFWFSWLDYRPATSIYRARATTATTPSATQR